MLFNTWIENVIQSQKFPQTLIFNSGAFVDTNHIIDTYFAAIAKSKKIPPTEIEKFKARQYQDLLVIKTPNNLTYYKKNMAQIFEEMGFMGVEESGIRFIVIYDLEKLDNLSSNVLLKFLEEPQTSTYVLMFCSDYNKVKDTIKSRCQFINLTRQINAIKTYKKTVSNKELLDFLLFSNKNQSEIQALLHSNELLIIFNWTKKFLSNLQKMNADLVTQKYRQYFNKLDYYKINWIFEALLFFLFKKSAFSCQVHQILKIQKDLHLNFNKNLIYLRLITIFIP